MRHGLRRLDPVDFKQPVETNNPGQPPVIMNVEIWRLFVNDEYQRDISRKGQKHILQMATNWDWEKYTPISIVVADQAVLDDVKDTVYEVVDGQHQVIAAATNGNVHLLPAILKQSKSLKEKADAFVGINKRVAIPKFHQYNTALAAGDENAISVNCALSFSKCTLLEYPKTRDTYKPGETLALAAMQSIVRSDGEQALTRILRIGRAAEVAPISAGLIKALSFLIKSPDDAEEVDQKLVTHLKVFGAARLELEAKAHSTDGKAYDTMAEHMFMNLAISKPKSKSKQERRRFI